MKVTRIHEADVKAIFETAADQAEALVALYKLVFPEWDSIEKLHGWPTCNMATSSAICKMFRAFDERHSTITAGVRSLMPGGMWMNNGFSIRDSETLRNWEVRRCECTTRSEAV